MFGRPVKSSILTILAALMGAFAAASADAADGAPARHMTYASCGDAKAFAAAAIENGKSVDTLDWKPFGVPEKGWDIYQILISQEIGTTCGVGTASFAEKLAAFQARYKLPPTGVFDQATFEVFKGLWQERRPFIMVRVLKLCPDAPAQTALAPIPAAEETFGREGRYLRADVLAAYERMIAAARDESWGVYSDPKALTIFSGYRSPESDADRCEHEHNCDGAHRAVCSAHRTGTAIDLNVGWVEGVSADQTTWQNRMLQTRGPAYRWLVKNAGRFGFVNYPFEPWHWEYVGTGPDALQAMVKALTPVVKVAADPAPTAPMNTLSPSSAAPMATIPPPGSPQ